MNSKFFYLYLVGGITALILLLYQLLNGHKDQMSLWNIIGYGFFTVILLYLAFKAYREKKDKELM